MNKKYLLIILFCYFCLPSCVFASSLNYKIVISGDKLNNASMSEEKKYLIDNSVGPVENGFNDLYEIYYTDVYATPTKKYDKKVTENSSNREVLLKTDFTIKEFANSLTLKNCFDSYNYKYTDDYYEFSSNGVFYCNYVESLNVSVVSDRIIESNGTKVSDNVYSWDLSGKDKVSISIKIASSDEAYKKIINHVIDEDKETFEITPKLILILSIFVIAILVIIFVCKIKFDKNNKI